MSGGLLPLTQRRCSLTSRIPLWTPRTIHAVLDAAAEEFPDRPFILGGATPQSYSAVAEHSRRIAVGLRAAGIGPGDKVALVLANYPEYVPLKYAIARLGAVAVPINIMLKAQELAYVLRQSDSKLLVTMDRFRGVDHLAILDEICPDWVSHAGGEALPELRQVVVFPTGELRSQTGSMLFDDLSNAGPSATSIGDLPSVDPAAVCDILYTSGTTGPAKGVQLTHDMLMRTAFGSAFARGFEDGRRIVFSLPMFHVFGYVEGMLSVPFVGGAIIPQLKFDALETLRAVERYRANDALLIPAMSLALIDAAEDTGYDLPSLHSALASGGKAPPHLWAQLRQRLGIAEITTGYGMTETTASTTVTGPDDPEERLLTTNGRLRQVGPAADPDLDGILVDYRVMDTATGTVLPHGEVGELQARGMGVTPGYYKKPTETAEAFTADGWLRTGDLGTLDADRYIVLLGRTKESYRCGGEQVLPSEVEDMLAGIDGVGQIHIAPLPDERMGEVGVAFIVRQPGSTIDEVQFLAAAAARLARYKVPRHAIFVEVDDIPLTASGRAKKFELTRIAQQRLGLS